MLPIKHTSGLLITRYPIIGTPKKQRLKHTHTHKQLPPQSGPFPNNNENSTTTSSGNGRIRVLIAGAEWPTAIRFRWKIDANFHKKCIERTGHKCLFECRKSQFGFYDRNWTSRCFCWAIFYKFRVFRGTIYHFLCYPASTILKYWATFPHIEMQ